MKPVECGFESEVLAAVLQSRWPDEVDISLSEHVASCAVCSGVVAIADAFDAARQHTHASAVLPDASRIWWFAQIRARREAAEEAGRPILATQIAAFAWAVGLLAVCLGTALTLFQGTRNWIVAMVGGFNTRAIVSAAMTPLLAHGVLIALAAAIVVLLPAAAYFAMGKE